MSQPDPGVVEAAPAKVNLSLHVVGRRADGYHQLESLVAFTAYGDTVAAAAAADLSLSLDGPFASALTAQADNLVLRAARTLAAAAGITPAAHLTLTKRLPVASGIGGGSTDAAATLRALVRLWQIDLPSAQLARMALDLGADVPVCLAARPALLRGIGERVDPLPPLPAVAMVLVNPGRPLATPPVFKARRGPFRLEAADPIGALAAACATADPTAGLIDHLGQLGNDLTDAALSLEPEIARVLARLAAAEGCRLARMSGSGATCFGLFPGTAAAEAAAARLRTEPGWWAVATRIGA